MQYYIHTCQKWKEIMIHDTTWINLGNTQFSSVQFSHSVVSKSLRPHEPQHARPPCPSPTSRAYPNSCPLSQWCHLAISSSVVPFSSCPQSLPASGSFQMSQLFTSGSQSTGVSASASVLPMNTQDWSPLGWTGWISLQSKGLSRVFSNTTVQKHITLSKICQTQKDKYCMILPRRDYQELRRRGRNQELLFNKHRISIQDDEKVLEMDSGWYNTVIAFSVPESWIVHLKIVKMAYFVLCIFCHNLLKATQKITVKTHTKI